MKNYETPKIELVVFSESDILTASVGAGFPLLPGEEVEVGGEG